MMHLNLRPGQETVYLMRPVPWATEMVLREQDAPILPPPLPMTFSRAEWSVLVTSGLFYALGVDRGWRDWDAATAFRATEVTERDHMLVVASLLLQGHEFGHGPPWPPGLDLAGEAILRIAARAAQYREQESITTPMVEPWPGVLHTHAGYIPDPSFQAPLLEHAVEATHVDVLIDLAKQGEEATFKDLARTLGVAADRVDALWTGTVRRVKTR